MISYVDPFIDPGWEDLSADLDGDEQEAIEGDEDEGPRWAPERGFTEDDDDDEE